LVSGYTIPEKSRYGTYLPGRTFRTLQHQPLIAQPFFFPLFDVESTGTAALAFQGIVLLPQFPQQPSILCLKNLAAITTAVDGQVHADGLREGRAIFRAQTFQI